MRILHVHDQAHFQGGVEQILSDTALGLAEQDWPQALLTLDGQRDADFCKVFERVSTTLQDVSGFQPDAVLMHKVACARRVTAIGRTFPTAHMVHDHDLVCPRRHKYLPLTQSACNRPAGIGCYTRLCALQRAPENSVIPFRLKGTASVREHLQAGQFVRRHLVGSAFMKNELTMNGYDPKRISVIHPVPASLQQPAALPMETEREILFVGQIIRGKGIDLLLQALRGLKDSWHATIIGAGNHHPDCKKLCRKLGIEQHVTFAGWVEHQRLEQYYRRARVIVVPSRWPEPFGMVGLEAMARSRPVVGFDVGGISDWLDHQVTGLLVPQADVTGLSLAMQTMLDHPELAEEMGQAGARRVARHFTHKNYLAQISHHLESLQ
jgi:glycosyltransferase involved in cell wall biosynthesis